MKKLIIDYIRKANYQPSTKEELIEALEIDENEILDFESALEKLVLEYEIFLNKKKDRYLSPRIANMYKGIINVKQGFSFGFIKSFLPFELYVPRGSLCGAFNGDEVLFSLADDNVLLEKSDEAIVQKVLKRKVVFLVGEVYKHNNLLCLNHSEKGFPEIVRLKNTDKIRPKQIVRTKVTKYDSYISEAEVIDVLGDADDIGMDITQIALSYDFKKEFSDDVLKEVNSIVNDIESEKQRRVDYTNELVFTIDGKDAKDLDDAVSIKKLENGNYKLGVYIADVSYYVTENSEIDKEAFNRGTSVYLVDRVIPMLPVRLSNDLCSLNPNEDKLVIACIMEFNQNAELVQSGITEGVIKTTKKLNYEDCNKVLYEGVNAVSDYGVAYESLLLMEELASKLFEKKHNRGALDFDIPESKVICDETGKAVDVVVVDRGISERIIEEFMIKANETVSEFIEQMDLPFIYRVHDEPDNIRFHSFKVTARNLGYQIKSLYPMELQKLLEVIDEKDQFLKTIVLRLMAKAVYSETNIGHFGLASRSYTHFTSPIRRYPDLIVHRLIRKYIFNHDINADEFSKLTNEIAHIALHSSEKEREAAECELRVLDMKKAEYMEAFVGSEFSGNVSSVTKFGVFVTTENGVDGLVHVSNMEGDYYEYDSNNNLYIGRRSNKKIRMGDTVKVLLIKADKKTSEIDFKLVYNHNVKSHSYYKVKEKKYGKNNKTGRKTTGGKKYKNNRKK